LPRDSDRLPLEAPSEREEHRVLDVHGRTDAPREERACPHENEARAGEEHDVERCGATVGAPETERGHLLGRHRSNPVCLGETIREGVRGGKSKRSP
jgi:hypothetical protein